MLVAGLLVSAEMRAFCNPVHSCCLDLGCGSGILSIIAERCGFAAVLAIDCDPQAVKSTCVNLGLNHCRRVQTLVAAEPPAAWLEQADVVLANVPADVHDALAGGIGAHIAADAAVIISGFGIERLAEMEGLYTRFGLHVLARTMHEGWGCVLLRKSRAAGGRRHLPDTCPVLRKCAQNRADVVTNSCFFPLTGYIETVHQISTSFSSGRDMSQD
jgi:hypothetical protein